MDLDFITHPCKAFSPSSESIQLCRPIFGLPIPIAGHVRRGMARDPLQIANYLFRGPFFFDLLLFLRLSSSSPHPLLVFVFIRYIDNFHVTVDSLPQNIGRRNHETGILLKDSFDTRYVNMKRVLIPCVLEEAGSVPTSVTVIEKGTGHLRVFPLPFA